MVAEVAKLSLFAFESQHSLEVLNIPKIKPYSFLPSVSFKIPLYKAEKHLIKSQFSISDLSRWRIYKHTRSQAVEFHLDESEINKSCFSKKGRREDSQHWDSSHLEMVVILYED